MNYENIMSASLLLFILSMIVLIWWKAMFSNQKKEVKCAKVLFLIVSSYIWFRFVKTGSVEIVIEFFNNGSIYYSTKFEVIAFFSGLLLMFILDVIVASSVILELGIMFVTSQIIFTYINLILFYSFLKLNIEYDALYVFASFIVGIMVYLIGKFLDKAHYG